MPSIKQYAVVLCATVGVAMAHMFHQGHSHSNTGLYERDFFDEDTGLWERDISDEDYDIFARNTYDYGNDEIDLALQIKRALQIRNIEETLGKRFVSKTCPQCGKKCLKGTARAGGNPPASGIIMRCPSCEGADGKGLRC